MRSSRPIGNYLDLSRARLDYLFISIFFLFFHYAYAVPETMTRLAPRGQWLRLDITM